MCSNARKKVALICCLLFINGVSGDDTENSTIEVVEELITDLEKLPTSLTLFDASDIPTSSIKLNSKIAFLPLLAIAANAISLVNGIMILCERLEGKKKEINENVVLALKLVQAREKVVSKLSDVQEAIDVGIARIIDRTIQQQFEDQITINMAQFNILTEYYLNEHDSADRKALQRQCAKRPPASFMGVLIKLLPRFIDQPNDPGNDELFMSKAQFVLNIVQQFILAYPACNSMLKYPSNYTNVDNNALGTVKEILAIIDKKYAEKEKILENIIYPIVDKYIGYKSEYDPDDDKYYATARMHEDLNVPFFNYNYRYFIILYEERNITDLYQCIGKIYSRTASGRTAHVMVSTPGVTRCSLSSAAYCEWKTVSETYKKECPTSISMFALNVGEYIPVERFKNIGVATQGYSSRDIYPYKPGCITNFKLWYLKSA